MKANRRRNPTRNNRRQQQKSNDRWVIAAAGVLAVALFGFIYVWSNRGVGEFPAAPSPVTRAAAIPSSPAPAPETPPVAATTPPATAAPAQTAATPPPKSVPAQQPAPPASNPHPSVRRISVDELRAAMERGDVFVVDVRSADTYAAEHIPGAKHIAYGDVAKSIDSLPRDKMIVTYCT